MNSKTDFFIRHAIYNPTSYIRNFDHDLSPENQKIALLGISLLSLNKPFGLMISVGMNSTRSIYHLYAVLESIYQLKSLEIIEHLVKTAMATSALAATLFHFQTGLLIASFSDASTSLIELITLLQNENPDPTKIATAILQGTSSLMYLTFMLSGTMEYMLATLVLQGALNLYQASLAFKEENYGEGLLKTIIGLIRFKDVHHYVQLIQKRNAFLQLQKFSQLLEKINKSRETLHLISSPLHEKKESIKLIDAHGKEYNFGSHFHGFGQGLVKGMNLQFRSTQIDGKTLKDIDFKINHAYKDQLEGSIAELKSFSPEEMKDFLSLTKSHAKNITLETVEFKLGEETTYPMGFAHQITFEGLGKVFVGAFPEYPSIYNLVRVQIDENKSIYDLHEILSFFNLDQAIQTSTTEDFERLKMGHLFRIFYPAEALSMERKPEFFNLPISELKAQMIQKVPAMKQVMENNLDKMETAEILPGRIRYALPEISKITHQLGGRVLVAGICSRTYQESCERLVSILKIGMLSSELRFRNGLPINGISSVNDFNSGGSDSVFTQLLTQRDLDSELQLANLGYAGHLQIFISLDALNLGTYQYPYDNFGTRRDPYYASRPNIFEFTKTVSEKPYWDHEVQLKEALSPTFFESIAIPNQEIADYLFKRLEENGITKVGNKPIQDFIKVTNTFTLTNN